MLNRYSGHTCIEGQDNKEVLFARLVRITMFFLLAVYPFGMVVLTVRNKLGGVLWMDEKWLVALVCAMPLIALIILWKAIPEDVSSGKTVAIIGIMFVISLVARLVCSALLQVTPISDFMNCYEYALTGGKSDYLGAYPYLGAYALTLRIYFRIMGASVFQAQLLNALVTSAIPGLLFLAVKRVTGKGNVAIVAGMAYALFPSMIIYTSILSCEQFAQFFMAAFICAIAYFCTEEADSKLRWLYACAAGLAFGGLCVYKPLFAVVAPAFLMVSFCYEMLPILCDSVRNKKLEHQKLIRVVLLDLLVILLALFLSKTVIHAIQTKLMVTPYNAPFSLSTMMYFGLCPEGGGSYNTDVKNYVLEIQGSGKTPKEVDQIFYGALYAAYKDNPGALFELFYKKFVANWCGEGVYYYWTFGGEGALLQGTWLGEILFNIIPTVWFMILSAVICAGSMLSLIRRDSIAERYFDFLVTGIIFLFALMLIIIEAQGRYKSNLSPLLCIVFAMCLNRILCIVKYLADFMRRKFAIILKSNKII